MIFHDRLQAARLLAHKLGRFRKAHPLVLAVPRGAVPMGRVIADELGCDLDVVLVRKIGAPHNPELALGAISEFGDVYLSEVQEVVGASTEYLRSSAASELAVIRQRRELYSPVRKAISPHGRTVIIVDDGIATGATMVAAVRSARAQGARKIIVAAPVASTSAAALLEDEGVTTVFLDVPARLMAISEFYEEFEQVSDDEVRRLLADSENAA